MEPKKPEILIKTLGERQPGESWVQMVYGQSKSGKTFYAGTAGPRTLFLNIGDGLTTLESPAFTSRYPESKGMLTVDISEKAGDINSAFDIITRTIDFCLDTKFDSFDTVVLDEATALRKFAMNKAMGINTKENVARTTRKDIYVRAQLGDYGLEMDMVEWFLGTYIPIFKQAKKNFLMLAHSKEVYGKPPKQGDEAPLLRIIPAFTGKAFPDKVPAYFDDVWKSEVTYDASNGAKYRLITVGNEKRLIGSRHGGIFAPEEYDPNFLKLLNRIKNQIPFIAKPKVTPPNTNLKQG